MKIIGNEGNKRTNKHTEEKAKKEEQIASIIHRPAYCASRTTKHDTK